MKSPLKNSSPVTPSSWNTGTSIPVTALAPFLLIAFGLAWGIIGLYLGFPEGMAATFGQLSSTHPLFYLAVYSPAIAGLAVVWAKAGKVGLGALLSRLRLWRCSAYWYAFIVAGVPLLYFVGALVGGKPLTGESFDSVGALLIALLLFAIKGPIEEFGWRGLALPLLQRRMAPFWAGIVVGVIWGIWHLPAFALSGVPHGAWSFGPFFLGAVALSVITTAMFNDSRGSILLPMLLHFQLIVPLWPDAQPYDIGGFVFVAMVVTWLDRRRMFSKGQMPADPLSIPDTKVPKAGKLQRGSALVSSLLIGVTLMGCAPQAPNTPPTRPTAASMSLASGASARSERPPSDAARLEERFRSELDTLRKELGFPGATAAYVLRDGTGGAVATGLADVEHEIPMGNDSRMLAASVGKSFAGATVIALAEEGKLGLDDEVSHWLGDRPWFSRLANHESMTIRHLLTHSAGIADHVHDEAFARAMRARWRNTGAAFTAEELVEFVLGEPALFEAGEGWSYSDTGYILLGLVVERATGLSYYEVVERRFLSPLDLQLTAPSNRREIEGLSAGYTSRDNPFGLPVKSTTRPGVLAWHPGVEWAGGGFVSNSRDLAVWAKALYEGRAVNRASLAELFGSVPIGDAESGVRYGAGVAIMPNTPLGPSYGHGGAIPGYLTSMRYYSAHQVAVAFQVNTDDLDSVIPEMERRLAALVVAGPGSK